MHWGSGFFCLAGGCTPGNFSLYAAITCGDLLFLVHRLTIENVTTLLQIFCSCLNDIKIRTVYTKQWHNSVYKQELAKPQCCQLLHTKTWTQVNIITVTNCTAPAKQLSGHFFFKYLHVQKASHNISTDDMGKKFLHDIQVNTLHITLHSTFQMKANFMVPSMVMPKLSLHTPWKPYRGQRRYNATHS
jgi:hypothetical protein